MYFDPNCPTARDRLEFASALAFAAYVVDMEARYDALCCERCGYVKRGDVLEQPGGAVYVESCDNCGRVDWDNSTTVLTHEVQLPLA